MSHLFASQLDNEQVFLVIRQHWIILVFRLLISLFLFTFGIASFYFLNFFLEPDTLAQWRNIIDMFFLGYLAIVWLGFCFTIFFYYMHLQIITDIRLIDVNQVALFKRNVVELQLENVQEVTSETYGLLRTLIGFGNVIVQTSGPERRNFTFDDIANPEDVKRLILDRYEHRKNSNS